MFYKLTLNGFKLKLYIMLSTIKMFLYKAKTLYILMICIYFSFGYNQFKILICWYRSTDHINIYTNRVIIPFN